MREWYQEMLAFLSLKRFTGQRSVSLLVLVGFGHPFRGNELSCLIIFISLFGLLGAWAHDLCCSVWEFWNANLLLGRSLLLLDLVVILVVIHRFEEGVLSLRSGEILGLIQLGILVIHLHLVNTITSHGLVHGIVHLRLIVVVNDFSSLGLNSRLPNLGDKDAATATTFLGYIYK